ncbi:MAG: peptide chain release factor N(5)-glutamine methyltransferase [Deltaproteobacteria bacterium]|nr:peptide chain release factor N(5)-glutamine methyltransferase [Deltaproteobacteria bacterium]
MAEAPARWTVGSVLGFAVEDFQRRGLPSARLDAELLLCHVLGLRRIDLLLERERELAAAELASYRGLIQRRRRAEPVAYLVGTREFYGLPFRVDARVLVPRPDTETLVDVALARTQAVDLAARALDLCTGSGCVALALARSRPTWSVTGVDLSPDALVVARDNAARLGLIQHVAFVEGDLDTPLPEGARYDVITANPPYVPTAELAELDADVRDHEPRLALDGGPDGLALLRRIIERSSSRLTEGGLLVLEVGYGQAEPVAALLAERGFTGIERRRDLGGIDRVVCGHRA